jgi:subtilisin family serine protease
VVRRYERAFGHGTFVTGVIARVAPAARIRSQRVLDSDGQGNVFVVAQAILDAVDAGARALGTNGNELATFANRGRWIEVAAPGERIVGPFPDGRCAWWSGTSMATPFVTGQAALLLSAVPGLTATEAREAIANSAIALGKQELAFGAIDILGSLDYARRHHGDVAGRTAAASRAV